MFSNFLHTFYIRQKILLALLALCVSVLVFFSPFPSNASIFHDEKENTFNVNNQNIFKNFTASQNSARRSLIILTDGVDWKNISSRDTPHLAAWAAAGAMFNVVPPSIAGIKCPIDVALALNAGQPVHEESIAQLANCTVPKISPQAGGDEWDYWYYRIQNFRNPPERPADTIGFFTEALAAEGISTSVIGDSAAALMLNYDGTRQKNFFSAAVDHKIFVRQVAESLQNNAMTVVDASTTDFTQNVRRQILTRQMLDSQYLSTLSGNEIKAQTAEFAMRQGKANAHRVDQLLAQVPSDTLVLFTSLMSVDDENALQPGFISRGPKTQAQTGVTDVTKVEDLQESVFDLQTRQTGTALYSSLLPTFLQMSGVNLTNYAANANSFPNSNAKKHTVNIANLQFVGKKSVNCDAADKCFTSRVHRLTDSALRSYAIDKVRGSFFKSIRWATIAFSLIAVFGGMFFALMKKESLKRKIRACSANLWTILGLTISAVPISSHILTLTIKWWNSTDPIPIVLGGSWGIALIIALSGYFCFYKWRPIVPILTVCAITSLLLLIEVATGSQHLIDAPIGFNTLAAARFYGLGNEGFAILASTLLFVLGFLPLAIKIMLKRILPALSERVINTIAIVSVVICGGFSLSVIAAPSMGADFGGAISFSMALLLLIFLIAEVRISWKKIFVLCVVGGFAAVGIAVLDWLRGPKARTHLGSFIQAFLDGDAHEIVMRKISVNLRLLGTSQYLFVVIAGLLALIVVVLPILFNSRANMNINKRNEKEIRLKQVLISVGLCLFISFIVNDSGIVLPGMGVISIVPALVGGMQFLVDDAAILRWKDVKNAETLADKADKSL